MTNFDSNDDAISHRLREAAKELGYAPDRRGAVAARIERRRRLSQKRCVLASSGVLMVMALIIGVDARLGSPTPSQVVSDSTDGIHPFTPVRRSIEPGLMLTVGAHGEELDIRIGDVRARGPMGTVPLSPYEPFGAIDAGAGVLVTGSNQSRTGSDLVPIAVAVVSAPANVARLRLIEEGSGHVDSVQVQGGVAVLVVSPDENDPHIKLRVEAYDASGEQLTSTEFLPYSQSPWTCETNGVMTGLTSGPTGADRPLPRPAGTLPLAAPLPASCGK